MVKRRLNWGFWIVVSFVVFASGIFVMVYLSMTTRVDLVTDDYYEQELQYQDQIDRSVNASLLNEQVTIAYADSTVRVTFPQLENGTVITGVIHFFRPSDKNSDIVRAISTDSLRSYAVPISIFSRGLWKAKISWNAGRTQMYSEIPMMIQ